MSIVLPDLPDVDWSNPDVKRVLDILGLKYEQKCKENTELRVIIAEKDRHIAERDERIAERDERIAELEAQIKDLKAGAKDEQTTESHHDEYSEQQARRDLRKYNTREFKDYPKVDDVPRTRKYVTYDNGYDFDSVMAHTVEKTADIQKCPKHGTPLSEKITDTYSRITEDAVIGGGWLTIHWIINRRYCRKCRCQHSAQPENVLPGEHYGIITMATISVLRNLVISFGSIQKIILMIYGRFINISTIEKMYNTVSDECRPLYEEFMRTMKDSKVIRGDHTGWFLNGKTFYALVIISADVILYHLTPTKAGMVMESIMQDYGGITLSDSDASWNSIGVIWQKCLLHYLRDIEKTLGDNGKKKKKKGKNDTDNMDEGITDEEFKVFGHELKLIIKRAIKLRKEYVKMAVPEKLIRKLERRIERLIKGEYTSPDCNRYVKRLKRERNHILTFLSFNIEFHNNISERAMRPFSRMRTSLYGNRSERGLETTETMATIYATCELRRINPYHFLIDYLSGRIDGIPEPPDSEAKKHADGAALPATA